MSNGIASGKSVPFPRTVTNAIRKWTESNIETLDVAIVTDASKYSSRLVSVIPLCIQEDPDGIAPEKPLISDCPVILQGNVDGYSQFPLRKGDKVLIGYPKDSIEEFIFSNSTDQYFQVDSMKFQGSQAVVLGAVGQPLLDIPVSSTDYETVYHNTRIGITPEDTITITTPDGNFSLDTSGNFEWSNNEGSVSLQSNGDILLSNSSCSVSASSSGEVSLSNSAGNVSLQASGSVDANGATITTSGNVITASGTDLNALKAEVDSFKSVYNTHAVANHAPDAPTA